MTSHNSQPVSLTKPSFNCWTESQKIDQGVLGTTMRTVVVGDLKQQLSKKAPCRPYYIENETLPTLFAYTLRDLSTHKRFSQI